MKKTYAQMTAKILAIALVLPLVAGGGETEAKKAAPKLAGKNVTVSVGQKKIVKIKNVTAKKVKKLKLSVKDKKVATVAKAGTSKKTAVAVTGKKVGSTKATIKVKLKKKTYTLTLSIKVKAKSEPAPTQEPEPSEEPLPTIPPATTPVVISDDITVPGSVVREEKDMTYVGEAHLGGTGEMHIYKDTEGAEWIFKPAQSKGGATEIFRAFIQEAGYKLQSIVDPATAIEVGVGILGGKFGAYQRKMTTDSAVNFKDWQRSVLGYETESQPVTEMTDAAVKQFLREFVTDWLLGNYDAHGGNFVTSPAGVIYGVDKEQSFRYLTDPESAKMSLTYHPNESYGELEPIYNTIFSQYKAGKLKFDTDIPYTYIKRVEAVPDDVYREIFRRYAVALKGEGADAEAFLDAIVSRKNAIRKEYDAFLASLKA